jgi:holo-[acyl-carrier protein] synthase
MAIIGHGIDVVEVARIERMLREHGDRFVTRCFTVAERSYADRAARRRAEHYAARFACKEAVLKAMGTGWRDGIEWTDIEVVREGSGQPRVRLSGRAAEIADELGITRWHVSLSHINELAMASAIAD